MPLNVLPESNPEVDRAIDAVYAALAAPDNGDGADEDDGLVTLSRSDVRLMLAEIEGGREAFGTLVDRNAALREKTAAMRRTIDSLSMAMRGKA